MGTNLCVSSLIFLRCAPLWFFWPNKEYWDWCAPQEYKLCSWKGRLCQCVVRQKEIKREFLHSICTQHAFQIKSDSLLSLKNADCNNQILAGEETAKVQSYRSRSKVMKYLNRIRGKSKNEMSNAPEAAWNLTIWCIYYLLHYILWFAGIYANKIKLLTGW